MILIAFGANMPSRYGLPAETFSALLRVLPDYGVVPVRVSSLYVTEPVPVSDQPDYSNAVLVVETDLSADDLLLTLMRVESDFGRKRTVTNAPRVIDLDLIAHNRTILDQSDLVLPHPRMHERLFVLEPLCEIAPEWEHPVSGKSAQDLMEALL